jgi:hypothetical protein
LGTTQPVIKGNPWIDGCGGIKQIQAPCPQSEAKGRWVWAKNDVGLSHKDQLMVITLCILSGKDNKLLGSLGFQRKDPL